MRDSLACVTLPGITLVYFVEGLTLFIFLITVLGLGGV